MSNPSLKSSYRWEEDDEFNLLTAVLEIATESAESYDPSINLFDRVSKAMNKSLGYEEILNKVRDLQQRYHSHENAIKKDRIFMTSHEIWGSNPKNGGSNGDGCNNVTEKREMEEKTEMEDVYLVRKGKQEEPEDKCRKHVKPEEPEQKCLHCATQTTSQWRNGPMGPKTLCNACGIRYYKGRLEPDNRPFLCNREHSKPVKKVLELRRRRVEMFWCTN